MPFIFFFFLEEKKEEEEGNKQSTSGPWINVSRVFNKTKIRHKPLEDILVAHKFFK
jgi:hypothetical protein